MFVNNRRLAERLVLRCNELAEEAVARAHHGALARGQRTEIEELLKAGRIPCLVATSSLELELGIGMGAVDLVIRVESPTSVVRGLQRVGRAGHDLGAISKGRIFPKFRADLLESAIVARAMREGAIEVTRIPQNPLDVRAQQIAAIRADEEIAVDDLYTLVSAAYPFSDLARARLENVLDMLAGRYPSDAFAELRPRIVWDRTVGVIRGLRGSTAAGRDDRRDDPRRGLFCVFQVEGGRARRGARSVAVFGSRGRPPCSTRPQRRGGAPDRSRRWRLFRDALGVTSPGRLPEAHLGGAARCPDGTARALCAVARPVHDN